MSFPPKRILVATDFSGQAGVAADAAVALAKPLRATLVLAHVTNPIAFVDYAGDMARLPKDPHFKSRIVAETQKAGEAEVSRLRALGGKIEFVALEGHPTHTLCTYAKSKRFDLIVLGSLGLTGLKHLLMGSTAETVVRHSSVAVLTIRPAE